MDGVPSLRGLTDRIQEAQQRLLLARRELEKMEVAGSAGGGLVTIGLRGTGEVSRVVIDQAAVDRGDAESLSQLVFAAFGEATDALKALTIEKMAAVTAGLPTEESLPEAH